MLWTKEYYVKIKIMWDIHILKLQIFFIKRHKRPANMCARGGPSFSSGILIDTSKAKRARAMKTDLFLLAPKAIYYPQNTLSKFSKKKKDTHVVT